MAKSQSGLMTTPVWLLTGPLGSGKTTLLRQLLSQKPARQHWGVLINDISAIDIDNTLIDPDQALVHTLPGGCICCSVQQDFLTALDILTRQPLDALWIEPTGMGDPQVLVSLLRQHPKVDLRGVIAVLDASEHSPEELQRWQSLMNMVTIADGIVINKQDQASAQDIQQLETWLKDLYPPKQWLHTTQMGQLPLERAEQLIPYDGLRLLTPAQHAPVKEVPWPGTTDTPAALHQRIAQVGEQLTLSWQWYPEAQFDWRILWNLFQQLGQGTYGDVQRAKGVLRTAEDSWMAFQWANGQAYRDLSSWRRDSRLMLVLPVAHQFDISLFEQGLNQALQAA